jgi:ATP-dependent helicase HrpB
MSATLDAAAVSSFLGGCPIVDVPGRLFPLDIQYHPHETATAAAIGALEASTGDVLCFLPGAGEIRRAIGELQTRVNPALVEIVPLHGSLDAAEQDRALHPSASRRRIWRPTSPKRLTVPR